jgi:hypothetical protein
MQNSDVHTLDQYAGTNTTFLLPLYVPFNPGTTTTGNGGGSSSSGGIPSDYVAGNGNGSHYYYNITRFVSVKITSTSNGVVNVTPSPMVVDFSQLTFSTAPVPAGSGASGTWNSYTFVAPKLTQ